MHVGATLTRYLERAMCLTCGCMDAHLEMGAANITYEDVKRAADANGRSVAETLDILERTVAKDRSEHAQEYAASRG
jgi:hypothetical protein